MAIDFERLGILVVDDNSHMRALIKAILTSFGVRQVVEASDGSDALQELRSAPADLMIADWMMEPVDGLDLARLIRTASDSPNPFLPIIMLTGHTERHRVEEARDSGVTEFLAKPVSPMSLYSRLERVIFHPRPYIKTPRYTGPCRRRKSEPLKEGMEERRQNAEQV